MIILEIISILILLMFIGLSVGESIKQENASGYILATMFFIPLITIVLQMV